MDIQRTLPREVSNHIMSDEKTEGNTKTCYKCGKTITCRMTQYKGYENKLQWQNDDNSAHYDRTGNCKEQTTTNQPTAPVQKTLTQAELKQRLDDAWQMAFEKAERETGEGYGHDKDTMILAQVFFKGIVEWTK